MRQMGFDFAGCTALVTGATGGIGRELVQILLESGANVVAQDLKAVPLAALRDELTDAHAPDRLAVIDGDASEQEVIHAAVATAIESFGTLDFLIPVAGIYPDAAVADTSDELWQSVQRINLEAVFRLLRSAIPVMTKGGSIVNFASVAGHRGSQNHGAYAASKAGVIALSRSLAHELGPRGIRVNVISPGTIATPMVQALVEERGESMLAGTPLGRFGEAREVAAAALFLCSDGASFINGETLHVNGGLFMAG